MAAASAFDLPLTISGRISRSRAVRRGMQEAVSLACTLYATPSPTKRRPAATALTALTTSSPPHPPPFLPEVPAGPRGDRFASHLRGRVHREHHYPDRGCTVQDAPCRFETVHVRHRDVHHHDVGLQPAPLLDGLDPVVGSPDCLDVGVGFQQ